MPHPPLQHGDRIRGAQPTGGHRRVLGGQVDGHPFGVHEVDDHRMGERVAVMQQLLDNELGLCWVEVEGLEPVVILWVGEEVKEHLVVEVHDELHNLTVLPGQEHPEAHGHKARVRDPHRLAAQQDVRVGVPHALLQARFATGPELLRLQVEVPVELRLACLRLCEVRGRGHNEVDRPLGPLRDLVVPINEEVPLLRDADFTCQLHLTQLQEASEVLDRAEPEVVWVELHPQQQLCQPALPQVTATVTVLGRREELGEGGGLVVVVEHDRRLRHGPGLRPAGGLRPGLPGRPLQLGLVLPLPVAKDPDQLPVELAGQVPAQPDPRAPLELLELLDVDHKLARAIQVRNALLVDATLGAEWPFQRSV
mmetsp:Transcript_143485/g.250452  ORF Transcript_143485/g.250452 Transcript_143485/m.250452 type:complete len:366 (+) Transcript_143485:3436-4533(+)